MTSVAAQTLHSAYAPSFSPVSGAYSATPASYSGALVPRTRRQGYTSIPATQATQAVPTSQPLARPPPAPAAPQPPAAVKYIGHPERVIDHGDHHHHEPAHVHAVPATSTGTHEHIVHHGDHHHHIVHANAPAPPVEAPESALPPARFEGHWVPVDQPVPRATPHPDDLDEYRQYGFEFDEGGAPLPAAVLARRAEERADQQQQENLRTAAADYARRLIAAIPPEMPEGDIMIPPPGARPALIGVPLKESINFPAEQRLSVTQRLMVRAVKDVLAYAKAIWLGPHSFVRQRLQTLLEKAEAGEVASPDALSAHMRRIADDAHRDAHLLHANIDERLARLSAEIVGLAPEYAMPPPPSVSTGLDGKSEFYLEPLGAVPPSRPRPGLWARTKQAQNHDGKVLANRARLNANTRAKTKALDAAWQRQYMKSMETEADRRYRARYNALAQADYVRANTYCPPGATRTGHHSHRPGSSHDRHHHKLDRSHELGTGVPHDLHEGPHAHQDQYEDPHSPMRQLSQPSHNHGHLDAALDRVGRVISEDNRLHDYLQTADGKDAVRRALMACLHSPVLCMGVARGLQS